MATLIEQYLDERLGLTQGRASKLTLSPPSLLVLLSIRLTIAFFFSIAPEILERLVSEGDDIAGKRRELRAEKERLDEALGIIHELRNNRRGTPRASDGDNGAQFVNSNGLNHLVNGSNGTSTPRLDVRSPGHRSVAGSVTQLGDPTC